MKCKTLLCQVALVGAIGCSGPVPGPTPPTASSEIEMPAETTTIVSEDGTAITWVRLKVPNMFWGSCAASVRGDLSKIPSVSDIETDPGSLTCSFKISDPDVDYEAELAKYAETNTHLADYTIE